MAALARLFFRIGIFALFGAAVVGGSILLLWTISRLGGSPGRGVFGFV